ncbi:MAG: alpha/beta fold hydrolase [Dehalococcoidia bacterium]
MLEPSVSSVSTPLGEVHFRRAGAGDPVVFLHDDTGPHAWAAFPEEVAARADLVALDIPGFGASPRAEWARHPRDLAAIVLAALRELGLERATLVGAGFGGWVAAEIASFAHPELAALVLVAPAGLRPDEGFILDQVLEEPVAYLRAGFSSDPAFEAAYPGAASDRALKARLDAARETVARVAWKPYMYSYELEETLKAVATPATLVWGTADAVIPPSTAARWRERLQNCWVELMHGGGHALDLERPGDLAQIVIDASESSRRA